MDRGARKRAPATVENGATPELAAAAAGDAAAAAVNPLGAPPHKRPGLHQPRQSGGDRTAPTGMPAPPPPQHQHHHRKPKKKVQQRKRQKQLQGCTLAPSNYAVTASGLRVVHPYVHRFTVFCKQRWLGRRLIDAVETEWTAYGRVYFLRAIELGLVLVNNAPVAPEYVLGQKDLITHVIHRHEPPVAGGDIAILHDGTGNIPVDDGGGGTGDGSGTDGGAGAGGGAHSHDSTDGSGSRGLGHGLVVVDKPATMPVHPCGSYFHNSVVSVLGAYHPHLRGIKTIHRLDRLTSGVLLFATTGAAVKAVSQMLKAGGDVEKVYYARVVGRFPASAADVAFSATAQRLRDEDGAWLSLEWLAPGGGDGGGGDDGDGHGDNGGDGGSGCNDGSRVSNEGGGASTTAAAAGAESQGDTDAPGSTVTAAAAAPSDGPPTKWWCSGGALKRPAPQLRFSCPLKCVDPSRSKHACHRAGKEAVTHFSVIGTASDGTSSIVRCVPKTGRTHQIRLHLQKLGFPIENDPNYGPRSSAAVVAAAARTSARELASAASAAAGATAGQMGGAAVKSVAAGVDRDSGGPAASAAASRVHPMGIELAAMPLADKARLLCRACQAAARSGGQEEPSELFHQGVPAWAKLDECEDGTQ